MTPTPEARERDWDRIWEMWDASLGQPVEFAHAVRAALVAKIVAGVERVERCEPDEKPEGGVRMYENELGDWLNRNDVLDAIRATSQETTDE